MKSIPQKPVRVETATVRVFQCPVCDEEVQGTVEVAIRLGTVTLVPTIGDGDDTGLEATATATTEMRGLTVRHQCNQVALPDTNRATLSV